MTTAGAWPEHDKLARLGGITQEVGDFLDWLSSEGVHLMRWVDREENVPCPMADGFLAAGGGMCVAGRTARGATCSTCRGIGTVVHRERGWAPEPRDIPALIAACYGIDQVALEREKRAMLEKLRTET